MYVLLGLGLAALLYFWLSGHRLARMVTFLVLAVLLGFGGVFLAESLRPHPPTVSAPTQHIEQQRDFDRECREGNNRSCFIVQSWSLSHSAPQPQQPGWFVWLIWFGGVLGVALAWPIASLPIWLRRKTQS